MQIFAFYRNINAFHRIWGRPMAFPAKFIFYCFPVMVKKFTFLGILFISLFFTRLNAATCVALGTGDWEDPANWSCGSVPTCGDSVVIPALKTVSITTQLDYSGCGGPMAINVYGELHFETGKKMSLACGSVLYVQAGGSVTGGGGGGNSNLIDICGNTAWTAGMGDVPGPAIIDASGVTPLPVELLYFDASPINNTQVKLTWATATETHNKHFEIEGSKDGINFNLVAIVKAAGNGNSLVTRNYEYTDLHPYSGTSYYRMKQVDLNGDHKYYHIVGVTLAKKTFTLVYPNPAAQDITVFTSEENTGTTLRIFTVTGDEVFSGALDSHSKTIDVSTLRAGLYFVEVNGTEKIKIAIQK